MHIKNKRGQSTVEYILLVTAVIAVMIVFINSGGGFKATYNATLNQATQDMNSMAGTLVGSHSLSPIDNSVNAGLPPDSLGVNVSAP